jgi:hypothetical protein
MSQATLAGRAVVTAGAIMNFENGTGTPRPSDVGSIRAALEKAGVVFINGDEPGVKLRRGSAK